jgi:hypothetical protein
MTDQASFEDRLRKQIDAYHEAALIYAAVKLGLPDRLAKGPATAEQMAATLDLSAPHLKRFLRGLCSIGVCEELPDGEFALTQGGHSLRPGSPSRLAEKVQIVVGQYWWPWASFTSSLKDGKPAFEQCFGIRVADWRAKHPEQGELFDAYLTKETEAQLGPIVEALDLSNVGTVAVLQAQSQFAGAFDQARMAEMSQPFRPLLDIVKRVGFVPGNLVQEIPIQADLYLLMGVLQQYGDEDATTILRNCRAAMPDGARLVIVERLSPERAGDDPAAVMLDLHMMTITGGRVRSLAAFDALLADAGLTKTKAKLTTPGLTVIEVVTR